MIEVVNDPLTTVTGRVLHNGQPVVGAEVRTFGVAEVQSNASGNFTIQNVPTSFATLWVTVGASGGPTGRLWGSATVAPIAGGTTPVGDIVLDPLSTVGTELPTGGLLSGSLAIGDLDRDGLLDLVVLNTNSSNFSVLMGLPHGLAGPAFEAPVLVPTGAKPEHFDLGDVNEDGILDVVTASPLGFLSVEDDQVLVTVHLGRGDGTFVVSNNYYGDGHPRALNLTDLDVDGHVDAVVATGTSRIFTQWGFGDGLFEQPEVSELPQGTVQTCQAVAHLDNDTWPDTVSGFDTTNGTFIDVLYGEGMREFSQHYLHPSGATGYRVVHVAAGDLNNDGAPDVVVGTAGPQQITGGVRVFLQDPAAPRSARFLQPVSYPVGGRSRFVSLADLNGDEMLDVVSAGALDTVRVLFGNGNGTLQPATSFDVGENPQEVRIVDLNGDGVLDLVTANATSNSVSILLGRGEGNFQSGAP